MREEPGIAGDAFDGGIDLVAVPHLGRLCIGRERSDAQPHQGNAIPRRPGHGREHLSHGSPAMIIRQRLTASLRVPALQPMKCVPMEQPEKAFLAVGRDPVDTKKAPLGIDDPALTALAPMPHQKQCPQREPEACGSCRSHKTEDRRNPEQQGADQGLGFEVLALESVACGLQKQPSQAADARRRPEVTRVDRPVAGTVSTQQTEPACQGEGQGILGHPGEQEWRNQGIENTPQKTAHRQPKIEFGQVPRRWAGIGQAAMTGHGRGKEGAEAQRQDQGHRLGAAGCQHDRHAAGENRQGSIRQPPWQQLNAAEHQDETQQIQRKRNHPEQRHRRQVRRDEGRGAQHQTAGYQGQQQPETARPPGWSGGSRRAIGRRRFRRELGGPAESSHRGQGTGRRQHSRQDITPGPPPALLVQGQVRLDEQRIAQQRQHTAGVARRVQPIRIPRRLVRARGQPALQHRAARGQHQERNPHTQAQ